MCICATFWNSGLHVMLFRQASHYNYSKVQMQVYGTSAAIKTTAFSHSKASGYSNKFPSQNSYRCEPSANNLFAVMRNFNAKTMRISSDAIRRR